ncbi:MAG: type VI secretion system-associated protein TagF [Methylococcaceae bacterium]|nr:type VI secretion system-associated protein TagF [Methylococcaceae bacterium]
MASQVTGFYGKLPSHGDFLSRRLPRQFIEPWDQWLQGGLAASREQLGKAWLNTFLVSPIWEFALAPGLCGEDAWAGVMMPSVDKVGRYFPLTLVAKVDRGRLTRLFDPGCGWFDALAELALSTLEYDFDLHAFDRQLEHLNVAEFLVAEDDTSLTPGGSGRMAFQFLLDNERDTPQAFAVLGNRLCERFLAGCSYWRSSETEDTKPVLLLCEGLPPIDAYIGFLNGDWPPRGWNFFSSRLVSKDGTADSNDMSGPVADVGLPPVQASNQTPSLNEADGASEKVSDDSKDVENIPSRLLGATQERQTVPAVASVNKSAPPAEPGGYENLEGDAAPEDAVITRPTGKRLEVNGMEWESCALSVVGMRRQLNEDAILDRAEAGLWAVADGMGGHSAGDVASQALVKALARISRIDDLEHYSEQVASCLHRVNRDLLELAESRGYGQIIGSTVVVLLIAGTEFRYLWAGDSRLYRYRKGKLEQLTTDHSLYNESISLGLSPLDGSLEQGRGNVITRAVGADPQLKLDYGQGKVEVHDVFILCSDGIDKELSHAEIAALCATGTVEEIAHGLVQEAESKGGRDNISVIVIKAADGNDII